MKKSTANQREEHNVEKYIQCVTTQSLTIRVYLHSFSTVVVSQIYEIEIPQNSEFELKAGQSHPNSSILVLIKAHIMQLPISYYNEYTVVTLDVAYLLLFSRY